MALIGTFIPQGEGFSGSLQTLTHVVALKFVGNDKESDSAPDYRVLTGNGYEVGAAWRRTSRAQRPYLSVSLDDPSFPAPLYARLVEYEAGVFHLLWTRGKND
jgi:uncharacterized protein (DUF736 family)